VRRPKVEAAPVVAVECARLRHHALKRDLVGVLGELHAKAGTGAREEAPVVTLVRPQPDLSA
jgi:hypothetical protein